MDTEHETIHIMEIIIGYSNKLIKCIRIALKKHGFEEEEIQIIMNVILEEWRKVK